MDSKKRIVGTPTINQTSRATVGRAGSNDREREQLADINYTAHGDPEGLEYR